MTQSSADIGIRVFLDDAASTGLFAINGQLGRVGALAKRAGMDFGLMSTSMLGLAAFTGIAVSFGLFAASLGYSVQQAAAFETAMNNIKIVTGGSDSQINTLKQDMLTWASTSVFSIEEITQGFVLLGQRGISLTSIINGVGLAGIHLAEALGVKPVEAMGMLASVMTAFNIPASKAAQTADLLFFAFEHGVPNVTQLTTGLARIGAAASLVHQTLPDVIPAFDVLARAMGNGGQAATGLYYFLRQVAAGTPGFRDEIAKLGITFYDSNGKFIGMNQSLLVLANLFQGKSMQDVNLIMSKLFNQRASVGVATLVQDLKQVNTVAGQLAKSHDALGQSQKAAQLVENSLAGSTKALLGSLRDLFILIGGPVAEQLTPLIQGFNHWVSTLRQSALENPKAAASFLLLGGAITGTLLVIMLASNPIGQFVLVVMLVIAAVVGLVAAIKPVSQWFQNLMTSTTPLGQALRQVGGMFTEMGHVVTSSLGPSFKQAGSILSDLGPIFGQLGHALQPLVPVLRGIAAVILGVLVGAFHGAIMALQVFIFGFSTMFVGLVQIITGVVQIIGSLFKIIIGLLTQNRAMEMEGWHQLVQGVVNIVQGMVRMVIGLFSTLFGSVIGFVVGFVQGVIQFFNHLYHTIVGGSIVPDMLHAIVNVFRAGLALVIGIVVGFVSNAISHFLSFASNLVNSIQAAMMRWRSAITAGVFAAIAIFQSMPGRVLSILAGLASQVFQAGANIVNSIANGIRSAIGNVGSAISDVAGFISAHMPHSPAKVGPLREINTWMPTMMKMMADSADSAMPTIHTMSSKIAGNVVPRPSSVSGSTGGGGNQTINLVVDGKVLTQVVLNHTTGMLQLNGQGRMLR